MSQTVFKRYECKYFLDTKQYENFLKILDVYAVADQYGESTICNIYYDTPCFQLIRTSIDKPIYKEKLRLRSYGIPNSTSACFLELKKKYQGVVYKRRMETDYTHGLEFLDGNEDCLAETQIVKEIKYFKKIYPQLQPKMAVFYKRFAYRSIEDNHLRFTIDSDIISRNYDLDLSKGIYGTRLTDKKTYLLEIKVAGAMPLWLTKALDENNIFPTSFSKYGTAYKKIILNKDEAKNITVKRGEYYV